MRALHATLAAALRAQTFAAVWEESDEPLQAGNLAGKLSFKTGGNVYI